MAWPPIGRASQAGAGPPSGEPRRLTARAFGSEVSIEVRDLPAEAAREALTAAFARLTATERLLAEAAARLNEDARADRSVALAPEVLELLRRALDYCVWSGGAVGPLGGSLDAHWRAAAGNPAPPPVSGELLETARCDRLTLDLDTGTASIAAGSRVAFAPFAAGFAIDRAVAALREGGSVNGHVRVGRIERGIGPGPRPVGRSRDGEAGGWPAVLPVFEGRREPLDRLRLSEKALAVLWRADWPGDRPLHVDQRTGVPPAGVWATVAVTELAVDAQALAVAAMVLGSREGRFRMATLQPEPSVLWLMGSGRGRALRSELNWTALHER